MIPNQDIKLHLGCGKKILKGWINIDKLPTSDEVIEDDIASLEKITNGTVDIIYACHVLEHFGRHEIDTVLKKWFDKLKNGSKIRIAVPDFDAVCKRYSEHKKIEEILGLVCGGQRNDYDFHKVIFNFNTLKTHLENAGFVDVKRYCWREVDHSEVDDYSQSYLPHMSKDEGMLMSLNVEAKKI